MVEFTTEPFELDTFPPHAVAARRVVDEAGLDVAVGPFGTGAEGEADRILAAVSELLRESLDAGATRISVQVSVLPEAEPDPGTESGTEPGAGSESGPGAERAAGEGGTP
ncbi:thiamine-binding protein [Kitasatospora purpeofusca]|uniref:thiamine-binding protein n=1 Tax=Kitasatospora purpeofusca TaxID=67352 RepID=UPI00367CA768